MTTIDRRTRVEKWIEYWIPAGTDAKDLYKIIHAAAQDWAQTRGNPWSEDFWPPFDDWFTIHPHDEHVIIRIKCPDETS